MDKTQQSFLHLADKIGSVLIGAGLGYEFLRDFHYAIIAAWAFIFVGAVGKIVVWELASREKEHS